MSRILISRTDSIGDVILTLPICNWLKEHFPGVEVYFLGRNYTKDIITAYSQIDYFIAWDAIEKLSTKAQIEAIHAYNFDTIIHVFPNKKIAWLARFAGIKTRIGTSHRLFHLFTCNKRVNFTRKNSDLHESQLNFELLRPLGLAGIPSIGQINNATKFFKVKATLDDEMKALLDTKLIKVILHPKSQGSAVEWGVENFVALSKILAKNDCMVYFSGTKEDGKQFQKNIPRRKNIVNITGKMDLSSFIAFINEADVLVAASTGPMHIAGMLNKRVIGLFSSRRPIHSDRWHALGENSSSMVFDESCEDCAAGKPCDCITKITPEKVAKVILRY